MRHAKGVRLVTSADHAAGADAAVDRAAAGSAAGRPTAGGDDAPLTLAAGALPQVEIWTDGACKGNPGPGGWGAWLRSGVHEKELFGGEAGTTNNRMELTAVIEALASLKRRCRVVLHTDSQYVQLGVTEWLPNWIRRGWKTAGNKAVKNADLWKRLAELAVAHDVDWRWVKGHAGVAGNERADQLANRGVEVVLKRR